MLDYANDLDTTVRTKAAQYRSISDLEAAKRPAPGKWSAKEIIGHLIDSASNNHQRFVRATRQNDLVFSGYEQNHWVELQNYNTAPWDELLDLWVSFNVHLARVMSAIPDEIRTRSMTRHNLDQVAFREVAADSPTTLDFFMHDYVLHLHHHIRQIEALGLNSSN